MSLFQKVIEAYGWLLRTDNGCAIAVCVLALVDSFLCMNTAYWWGQWQRLKRMRKVLHYYDPLPVNLRTFKPGTVRCTKAKSKKVSDLVWDITLDFVVDTKQADRDGAET